MARRYVRGAARRDSAREARHLRSGGQLGVGQRPCDLVARPHRGAGAARARRAVLRARRRLLREPPRPRVPAGWPARPLPDVGVGRRRSAARRRGLRRRDRDLLLPRRHRRVRAGPVGGRAAYALLRSRHAGHARAAGARRARRVPAARRARRLRSGAQLHRRRDARRAAQRDSVRARWRRSTAASIHGCIVRRRPMRASTPTRRTSAPTPPIGNTASRRCSSIRRDACRRITSSSAVPCIRRRSPGRRTCASSTTSRRPITPRSTARRR